MNSESLPGLPGPGDWGGWVNSGRACLRIQFTYWVGGLMVEHLKVLWSSLLAHPLPVLCF